VQSHHSRAPATFVERNVGVGAQSLGTVRTVDYDPFIKKQLSSVRLTLGPRVVQIWSRHPQDLEEGTLRSPPSGWAIDGSLQVHPKPSAQTPESQLYFLLKTLNPNP